MENTEILRQVCPLTHKFLKCRTLFRTIYNQICDVFLCKTATGKKKIIVFSFHLVQKLCLKVKSQTHESEKQVNSRCPVDVPSLNTPVRFLWQNWRRRTERHVEGPCSFSTRPHQSLHLSLRPPSSASQMTR